MLGGKRLTRPKSKLGIKGAWKGAYGLEKGIRLLWVLGPIVDKSLELQAWWFWVAGLKV